MNNAMQVHRVLRPVGPGMKTWQYVRLSLYLSSNVKINPKIEFPMSKSYRKGILHSLLCLIIRKLEGPSTLWQPSWIYANYGNSPRLPAGQPSWILLIGPSQPETIIKPYNSNIRKVHYRTHSDGKSTKTWTYVFLARAAVIDFCNKYWWSGPTGLDHFK